MKIISKIFILLSIILQCSFQLHAQKISTVYRDQWTGAEWVRKWRAFYYYDEGGNKTKEVYQVLKAGFGYIDETQIIYTYNSSGKLDSFSIQYWNGYNWINLAKYIYSYDENGYVTNELTQIWDSYNNIWKSSLQINYTNDATGNAISALSQEWLNVSWVTVKRTTYSYNENNQIASYIQEEFKSNEWIFYSRATNTYNENNLLINKLTDTWNKESKSWVNDNQYVYTYGSSGEIEVVLYQVLDLGWVNEQKDTFTYLNTTPVNSVIVDDNIFNVYPNPFSDILYVEFAKDIVALELTLMNAQGIVVYREILNSSVANFDLNNLPDGIYYVNIKSDKYNMTKLIVKE